MQQALAHRHGAVSGRACPRPGCSWTRRISRGRALQVLAKPEGFVATTPREKVISLISNGFDVYNPGDLEGAVQELLLTCPTPKDALAAQSFTLGQGTWEVFHAPHIARLSLLGTKFQPIRYTLKGSQLLSHVKYTSPLGSGWLSASGTMERKFDDSVKVEFDQFWVDGPDSLRETIPASATWDLDSVIGMLGRTAFFPQLAVFPVHYLDADLCVFEFTPLNSKIAVIRLPKESVAH